MKIKAGQRWKWAATGSTVVVMSVDSLDVYYKYDADDVIYYLSRAQFLDWLDPAAYAPPAPAPTPDPPAAPVDTRMLEID